MAGPVFIADVAGAQPVELEGLTLIFHARSGMTHMLAPPAPQILEALVKVPGDAAAVAARLGERFRLSDADAEAVIAARLAELEAIGLVRRL